MKGFEKAGKVLEFDRITEKLASLAATEGAAEALRALQPQTTARRSTGCWSRRRTRAR